MAQFSKISKDRLATAHKDLQTLFNEVIKHFDCTILYGHRSPEEQYELYKKGRKKKEDGTWAIIGHVVTFLDGFIKLSKHNHKPALAVDVVPYPIDWDNTTRMDYFGGFVMGIYTQLKAEGKITSEIRWGHDWDGDTELSDTTFVDRPHFQIN